jgi:pimeloyl-ACP methyl ester carboxylesterase
VVWALAGHHPERCRGVASLCVPYLPGGFALESLVPLVDRDLYPAGEFPYGQWDYYRFYEESFDQATADFEADVAATVSLLFRRGRPGSVGKPARSARVRANGGWFGDTHRAPPLPRDETMLSREDYDEIVAGLETNGFRGPNSWYLNDAANRAYAATVPHGGRLDLPVLFVHAAWDGICETVRSSLADPMRAACPDLTEETVDAGHELILESPLEVNAALASWLAARQLQP